MHKLKRSKIVNKTPEEVWKNYEDPSNNWIKWDTTLKAVLYEGESLKEGKEAVLILQNDKKINMKVLKVVKNNEFTVISENKILKIKFYHTLEKVQDSRTKITHSAEVEVKFGIFKFLEKKVCNEIIKGVEEGLVGL